MEISLLCPQHCHTPCTNGTSLICPEVSLAPHISALPLSPVSISMACCCPSNIPSYLLPYDTSFSFACVFLWYLLPGPCLPHPWRAQAPGRLPQSLSLWVPWCLDGHWSFCRIHAVTGSVCQRGWLEMHSQTIRGGCGGVCWAGRARTRLGRTYKPPKGQRGASAKYFPPLFVSLFSFAGCE